MDKPPKPRSLTYMEKNEFCARHGGVRGVRAYLARNTTPLPPLKRRIFWEILLQVCNVDTSVDPEHWSMRNPFWGHSLPVALLMHAEYGGVIIRRSLKGVEFYERLGSHYTNRLPGWTDMDMTYSQFHEPLPENLPEYEYSAEYLLEQDAVRKQFQRLKERFDMKLGRTPAANGDNVPHSAT